MGSILIYRNSSLNFNIDQLYNYAQLDGTFWPEFPHLKDVKNSYHQRVFERVVKKKISLTSGFLVLSVQ
jgi:hypothetical protein